MNFYKLTLQYRGSQYHGFQIQDQDRTIQGELNRALKEICKSEQVKTIGSGRTDAGVHARAQIIRAEIPLKMPGEKLKFALNAFLPNDIRVTESFDCDENFHPIYSAKSKEYHYYFTAEEFNSAIACDHIANFSFDLDIAIMQKGARHFVGKHDFINYRCVGTDVESTVREIFSAELVEISASAAFPYEQKIYCFKVVGNGFLKQMVRLMVGSLLSLGRHKITLQDLDESLKVERKDRYGIVAPPEGLYLYQVNY